MTMTNIEKLSYLIKDPSLERLDLTLSKPNIFEILRISHAEIRHSNFLAWLLDPQQSHNLGNTFLKWFLKDVFSDQRVTWINEFKVDSINTNDVVIHREYKNIDLLIETTSFVVIIENKFWSKEHSDQLKRYRDIIERDYPEKKHAFVFLTPDADAPEQESDKDVYVTFAYADVVKILENILKTFGHSISEKVKTYINDYVSVIRRSVMQDEDAIGIAQEIYKNHKDALDFIFEHKPDRLLYVASAFKGAVEKAGYVMGSPGKGYARFLTQKLNTAVPKGIDGGWRDGEAFMFELMYRKKNIVLACVVAPGSQHLREHLIAALKTLVDAKNPKGLKWSAVHAFTYKIDINNEKYDNLLLLQEHVEIFLEEKKEFIELVENTLLNQLENYKI